MKSQDNGDKVLSLSVAIVSYLGCTIAGDEKILYDLVRIFTVYTRLLAFFAMAWRMEVVTVRPSLSASPDISPRRDVHVHHDDL